jgi:hypothetical protein
MVCVYTILSVSSFAYGLAPSPAWVIGIRAVAGVGGAGTLLPFNWLQIKV